tara:strand:+ start:336 stop:482 length:147 start_codon:yes stop_codon:yes gene_type:complete
MEEEEIKKNDIFDKNYEEMDISDLEDELIDLRKRLQTIEEIIKNKKKE